MGFLIAFDTSMNEIGEPFATIPFDSLGKRWHGMWLVIKDRLTKTMPHLTYAKPPIV